MFDDAPPPLIGQRLHLGDRLALWQPDTGRHLWIAEDTPLANPPPALARRLATLGFTGSPELPYPARSRWALWFPESSELWHARPLHRGPGGFPFATMRLDPLSARIWEACDGQHTVAQIAAALALAEPEVRERMRPWMDVRVQALQLRERPTRRDEPALAHLLAPERPAHDREDHHYEEGATDLGRYHAEQVSDGATHFDDRETTFAHAFELPHPALRDRAYGTALGEALVARGFALDGDVLEVGPGTGAVCAALSDRARRYTRLDLSPELLATQSARCPHTHSLLGSATAMPLPDDSVDVVLSNEMIADLRAAPTPEGFAIDGDRGQGLYNTGAFAMVAEIARVLRPGGAAFVSEFGDVDELPEETTHLDHPEVSIHFGQVAAIARQHGLDTELVPLAELLEVDRTATWLSRPSFEALRARAHARGQHLQARAYAPATLAFPEPVEGLWWVPITEPGAAPILDRLWALILVKP